MSQVKIQGRQGHSWFDTLEIGIVMLMIMKMVIVMVMMMMTIVMLMMMAIQVCFSGGIFLCRCYAWQPHWHHHPGMFIRLWQDYEQKFIQASFGFVALFTINTGLSLATMLYVVVFIKVCFYLAGVCDCFLTQFGICVFGCLVCSCCCCHWCWLFVVLGFGWFSQLSNDVVVFFII